jgi:16S rRNA (uracil1498-N3)-methyltransferase
VRESRHCAPRLRRAVESLAVNARFYVPAASVVGSEVELPADEAQHVSRVLRLGPGDPLAVFNGDGAEFGAVVAAITKARVTVRLVSHATPQAELPMALTLAQAVLKGDKMDDVVRDAVMLGIAAVQPLVTARTEVTLAALTRGARRERWHRVAVSSAKQCGRAVVPAIAPPIVFDGPMSLAHLPAPLFILVEPGAGERRGTRAAVSDVAPAAATLVVGPEGGWEDAELAACAGHAHPLGLGALTLRADAAAIVATASLLTRWKLL